MRNKASIVVAILLLAVGFAAVSTTLIINGNAKIGENTDDFSVIFTAATLDGTDVYANVISQDKKTITFETSDLKTLNQTSVLNYEVTNNSANYDAEVQVNCKVKDNVEAKYTNIKNELENNATKVLSENSVNGTLTVTLNKTAIEEVREEYVCELTFNAVERDTVGVQLTQFEKDAWPTIASNIKAGNTDKYNVGDTKKVDLGDLGTHEVRISNMSACTTETSETACGFVVEFADVITEQQFNGTNVNKGGWKDSKLRTYINETIYNALPIDLQNIIVSTKVISGHGKSDSTNFETQDKLYLLNAQEVWKDATSDKVSNYDTSYNKTKQLDYYKNQGVTTNSYASAIKQYNGRNTMWWLRSAVSYFTDTFLIVHDDGRYIIGDANTSNGISPAFRIA